MAKPIIIFQGMSQSQGVFYFRQKLFFDNLYKKYKDEYDLVLIDRAFTPEDMSLIEKASIVHIHKYPVLEQVQPLKFLLAAKSNGGKIVVDLDDHHLLHFSHPKYNPTINREDSENVLGWVKNADYVTVASENLKEEILKFNKNVKVIENCIDLSKPQFVSKKDSIISPDGKVTIAYIAGASHTEDVKLLEGVVNRLMADPQTKGKVRFAVVGWDMRGNDFEVTINPEFIKDLGNKWTQEVLVQIKDTNGDVDRMNIPQEMRDKYRDQVILIRPIPIKPNKTSYYQYEKILTDNWKIFTEVERQQLHDNFTTQTDIHLPLFSRIWTKDVNEYLNTYDYCDIALAPLQYHFFNKAKSDLKLVEAATRKLPVVASDMEPYSVLGKSMENCILVDPKRPNAEKIWFKAIKTLVLNKELREELGTNLYNDVMTHRNIDTIGERRMSIYKELLKVKQEV